jgi:hypothetical protein
MLVKKTEMIKPIRHTKKIHNYKNVKSLNFENSKYVQKFITSIIFYHIKMGYCVHDALNEVVFYNTLNWTFKNELFWYDLKLSWFFQDET